MKEFLELLWIESTLVILFGACLYQLAAALVELTMPGPDGPRPLQRREVFEVRVERAFYRHHRALALVLLAVVAFYLIRMGSVDRLWPTAMDTPQYWLARIALLVALLILPMSLVLFWRPSRLRSVERWTNRWIGGPEHPAPAAIVLLASTWCLIGLVLLYLQRMN